MHISWYIGSGNGLSPNHYPNEFYYIFSQMDTQKFTQVKTWKKHDTFHSIKCSSKWCLHNMSFFNLNELLMVCSSTRIWSMPRSREPEDIFSEPSAKAPYRKWSPYFPPYRIQHLLSTVCRCQRNESWTRDFAIFLFAYCYVSNIASTHNLIHIHMNDKYMPPVLNSYQMQLHPGAPFTNINFNFSPITYSHT